MGSGNRKPHGRTVSLAAGYTAFVPAPLPPAFEWNPTGDAQRNRVFCATQMLEVLERR